MSLLSDRLRKLQSTAARLKNWSELGSELYAVAAKTPIYASKFPSHLSTLSIESAMAARGRRISGKLCALIAISCRRVLHLFAHGINLVVVAGLLGDVVIVLCMVHFHVPG